MPGDFCKPSIRSNTILQLLRLHEWLFEIFYGYKRKCVAFLLDWYTKPFSWVSNRNYACELHTFLKFNMPHDTCDVTSKRYYFTHHEVTVMTAHMTIALHLLFDNVQSSHLIDILYMFLNTFGDEGNEDRRRNSRLNNVY